MFFMDEKQADGAQGCDVSAIGSLSEYQRVRLSRPEKQGEGRPAGG